MIQENPDRQATYSRSKPTGLLRLLLRAPILLYRIRLGWILGHRFMMLTHVGRRTGKIRRNVVEVFHYDREKRESFVMSGWGAESDWYLNIIKNAPVSVRTGREQFVPSFRILSPDEARMVLRQFSLEHSSESKFFMKSFFHVKGNGMSFEDVAGLVPILAFQPKGNADAEG